MQQWLLYNQLNERIKVGFALELDRLAWRRTKKRKICPENTKLFFRK